MPQVFSNTITGNCLSAGLSIFHCRHENNLPERKNTEEYGVPPMFLQAASLLLKIVCRREANTDEEEHDAESRIRNKII